MLQAIRDKATGWIAWAIIILISVPFALWGVNEYFTPDPNVPVAYVEGEPVGYYDLQQAISQQRMQLRASLGSSLDEDVLREAALNSIIDRRVLQYAAARGGMRVGNEALVRNIRETRAFQGANGFSQEQYEMTIASQGFTPTGYEESLRADLILTQLQEAVAASAVVPASLRTAAVERRLQTRSIRTLTFSAADAEAPGVDDAALEAFYADRKADFSVPPTVRFEYVELDAGVLSADIKVDEQRIRDRYERDKPTFTRPEQRDVSHILIEVEEGADDAAVAEARTRIDALKAEIDSGAEFADVARASSEDIGSAEAGGSLGAFGEGGFDPAFDAVAFSGELGVVSDPVRTPFGWHLIRVDRIEEGDTRSYEEMREQLLDELRRADADEIFFEQVDRLTNLGFENPESLEPAANQLALEIQDSGLVTAAGLTPDGDPAPGLAGDATVVEAAFNDVRDLGTVSDVVELDETRMALLRVIERNPAEERPLSAVRGDVEAAFIADARAKAARERGAEVLAALRSGQDAAEVDGEWTETRDVARREAGLAGAVVETVFSMPAPEGDAPEYDGVATANGDFVVVELGAVDLSAAEAITGAGTGTAEGRLLGQMIGLSVGRAELQAYAVALREAADVSILDEDDYDIGAIQHGGGY